MANAKVKANGRARRASDGPAALPARLTADAQRILNVNRQLAAEAVESFRKKVEKRARRAVRDVERKILKQMHIATEEQVRRLEARVARLERQREA